MITLTPGSITLSQIRSIARGFTPISLAASCRTGVEASAKTVADIVAKGDPAYGINTGFGLLAKVHIPADQLDRLVIGSGQHFGERHIGPQMVAPVLAVAAGEGALGVAITVHDGSSERPADERAIGVGQGLAGGEHRAARERAFVGDGGKGGCLGRFRAGRNGRGQVQPQFRRDIDQRRPLLHALAPDQRGAGERAAAEEVGHRRTFHRALALLVGIHVVPRGHDRSFISIRPITA